MSPSPVVAVIHANPATMSPVTSAFTEKFPHAALWHLLDDRLVTDAERAGGLTESLHRRMATLIGYAVDGGADAVQLACSMYGPVTARVEHPVPVLASDQAMFDEVIRIEPGHVTILASLEPAAEDSTERLVTSLAEAGVDARVEAVVVREAKAASASNDLEMLGEVLAGAAQQLGDTDVVVLAQYSLAPVIDRIRASVEVPVLSGPHLAAVTLATTLEAGPR